MPATKITSHESIAPQVVGTVHSAASLRHALKLKAAEVDLLEIRVDHFAQDTREILRALPRLKHRLIVTVRHPAEGGMNALGFAKRRALFAEFLPFARFIDFELRSVAKLQDILAAARTSGVKVIVSNHHFHSTPSTRRIAELRSAAFRAGADVFKLAARAATPRDVATLLSVFDRADGRMISAMGMGPLGKASRLLFARAGSVLNYGYLDAPNASGQWSAPVLKQRLAEVFAD